jgi:hypothetical protein
MALASAQALKVDEIALQGEFVFGLEITAVKSRVIGG